MRERGPERDLDTALAALIEGVLLRAADTAGLEPAEHARHLAQSLSIGLRELVRAPLREALQAGYELGWRAAQEAQRQATNPSVDIAPTFLLPNDAAASDPPPLEPPPATPREPASATPAAPTAADATQHVHQVCVEVSPLPNFSAVNRFHAAVAGITDVADTTMVAFRDGRLTLRVEHHDGRALAGAVQALELGPLRVVVATPDRLELAMDSRSPSVVGRWRGRDATRRPSARGWRPSVDR